MRKQYQAKNGKSKADTGVETDNIVEKVMNLKSCITRSLGREPAHPAHLKGGDWTILSKNIIITDPAKLSIEREGRMKTFLNTQGLKIGREVARIFILFSKVKERKIVR